MKQMTKKNAWLLTLILLVVLVVACGPAVPPEGEGADEAAESVETAVPQPEELSEGESLDSTAILGLITSSVTRDPAAKIAGIERRKEKRAASARCSPRRRAAVMVTPEREVPGIKART